MNDETKAAVERFRTWEFDGLDARDHAAVLAHIDGEPARLAAAREEQREACATYVGAEFDLDVADQSVRRTPLDATPLADELRTLRAERDTLRRWVFSVSEALDVIEPVSDCRVELGADAAASVAAALRARVAELEAYAKLADSDAEDEERRADELEKRAERAEAQVAAARAVCASAMALFGSLYALDVLRAMDEAAGTAPAPPVAHARETGGEVVPGGGGVPSGPAAP